MSAGIVIVGAGLAGWTTAREFRKLDPDTSVLLVSADRGDFYAKPTLSNAFAQARTPAQLVTTPMEKMRETHRITVQPATRVERIDRAAQTITTDQGTLRYDTLVLASGARPIRVPVAGDAADLVQSVNSLDDFSAFHARLTASALGQRRPRLVIMGAGLIGCEFANDLATSACQVTVVDPANSPMAALLPEQAGAQLRDALSGLGVDWHFGATVRSVMHSSGPQGPALRVELSNGTVVAADCVLSAIGLRADTALAQSAGLACERGIVVDACLQTSDPHIHALGDAAQYGAGAWAVGPVTGGRTLPYVMPIMSAAKALAATLAGHRTEVVFPVMPVTIKTPALPIVVAAAHPGAPGEWRAMEPGLWHLVDPQGRVRGFVLAGKQTIRRAEQAKLVIA